MHAPPRPNSTEVYEVRVEEGIVYLIMERVHGASVDHALQGGPLPIPNALWIAEQVARGVTAAHALGFVHRDVKPATILVTPDGVAKLGDFGIAKNLNDAQSLTKTGQGMGTLAYVSPEQAANAKHVDHRADLYSLGGTLYHMIAGRPPFSADNYGDMLVEIFEEDPPLLQAFRSDAPAELVELVHELLEKDPGDRPSEASALAAELKRMRQGLP